MTNLLQFLALVLMSSRGLCFETSLPLILVHGAGSGAWCWFKVIAQLREAGLKNVTALDLAGCGIDPGKPRNFAEYTEPLENYMNGIPAGQKVILVGHSAGGLSVAHTQQKFSDKIKVSVYIAAPMSPSDFDLIPENDNLNTSSDGTKFDPEYSRKTFYQLCPPEDVVLASILDRPFPSLRSSFNITPDKYGSIPRVYIKTLQDKAFPPELQNKWISRSPPDQVFSIDSDHSPFFSATSKLTKLLLRIAHSYSLTNSSGSFENEDFSM